MTNCAACPEPVEGRGAAQHADARPRELLMKKTAAAIKVTAAV